MERLAGAAGLFRRFGGRLAVRLGRRVIASLITYRLWWSDRAFTYRLLAIMHILVLTGGAILSVGGWSLMMALFLGGYLVAPLVRRQWR